MTDGAADEGELLEEDGDRDDEDRRRERLAREPPAADRAGRVSLLRLVVEDMDSGEHYDSGRLYRSIGRGVQRNLVPRTIVTDLQRRMSPFSCANAVLSNSICR